MSALARQLPVTWAWTRARDLRQDAKKLRKAYRQDLMGEPCHWLASVYEEAAELIEKRIAEIDAAGDFPKRQAALAECHPKNSITE